MIISNVSRLTIGQLHEQLAERGVNQDRELRSNGGCGIKLKKEGERGFGFGRTAHRAAAWNRFEVVIRNTFATRGVATDQSAYQLAKQITTDLQAKAGPQQPLRLRQVAEVAVFTGRFAQPAGNAKAALHEWQRAQEAPTPNRAPAKPRVFPPLAVPARGPVSAEAGLILHVCRQTVGDEPAPQGHKSAPSDRQLAHPAADEQTRARRPIPVAPRAATSPQGRYTAQAELMLQWCDRIPARRGSIPDVVHPAPRVVRTPAAAVHTDIAPSSARNESVFVVVPPASESVPVLAAGRVAGLTQPEPVRLDIAASQSKAADALSPEQLSVAITALWEDAEWDPAESQGFQKVWNRYAAEAASTPKTSS